MIQMIIEVIIDGIKERFTAYSLIGLCLTVILCYVQLFSLGNYTMMDAVDDWIKSMLLLATLDCISVIYHSSKESE